MCTLFGYRRNSYTGTGTGIYMEGEARPVWRAKPDLLRAKPARSNYYTVPLASAFIYRTVVLSTVLHPHVNVRASVRASVPVAHAVAHRTHVCTLFADRGKNTGGVSALVFCILRFLTGVYFSLSLCLKTENRSTDSTRLVSDIHSTLLWLRFVMRF